MVIEPSMNLFSNGFGTNTSNYLKIIRLTTINETLGLRIAELFPHTANSIGSDLTSVSNSIYYIYKPKYS